MTGFIGGKDKPTRITSYNVCYTKLLRTAPGHGREDFETALKYELEIYSPVDDDGRFTEDVVYFAGQFVFDANKKVNEKIAECGNLILV